IPTWEEKDPVTNYEHYLMNEGLINQDQADEIRSGIKKGIADALKVAYAEVDIEADVAIEKTDVFQSFELNESNPSGSKKEMRFIDAISDGLKEAMRKHDKLVLMGQDIADYGGVFKVTEGFVEEFGRERVRNTPLCESAIVGSALGLSIKGWKGMMEMQFADFVTCGFNQIVNNLAKLHYRWDQNADVVVRMPTGAGVGAGPFHSQSNEAWFFHTPGLKIAYPAFPEDAKGLLLTAFEDPNPVMFFEHKALYRSLSAEVAEGYYTIPFGKANVVIEGNGMSVITYGMGVHWAMELAEKHPDLELEVVDLRTLSPIDEESIYESVKKTGKCIVLHEDCMSGGIGADLCSMIQDTCWSHLDAPVKRVASMDTPVPFAISLENQFLPKGRFEQVALELKSY
ncbi:MAG: transketolase C-terminal domain-containing protein, partial [Bacteroidota bacterium]